MSVRISAHDWVEGGITPDDAVAIARVFKAAGADIIDVLVGPVDARAEAGLRPHVPDAVRRSHPQRGGHRDDGRRRDLRSRPRRTASSRPAAPTCAPSRGRIWPTLPGRCTRRRSSATPTSRGRSNTERASSSSNATWSASAQRQAQGAACALVQAKPGARQNAEGNRIDDRHALLEDAHELGHEDARRARDHAALRLWLRMLDLHHADRGARSARLRERFGDDAAALRLMAQLQRYRRSQDERAVALLMVTGGNVTGLTDQLVTEGLVVRDEPPADRRAWIVRLTAKGRRPSTHGAEHENWILELFAGLDAQRRAAAPQAARPVARATDSQRTVRCRSPS